MRRCLSLVAAALMLLAACGPAGDEPTPEVTTVEPDEPTETTDAPEVDANPQDHWEERFADLSEEERAAVEDLAERLSARYYEIYPEPLEEVTWPDGSLGCPQPGQSYTQALVDGYRLILEYRGDTYAYHAGADGRLSYCANPAAPVDDGAESS